LGGIGALFGGAKPPTPVATGLNLDCKFPTEKHTCTISLQERHFPMPLLRHTQKSAVLLTLSNFIFAEFFTFKLPKISVDKPT